MERGRDRTGFEHWEDKYLEEFVEQTCAASFGGECDCLERSAAAAELEYRQTEPPGLSQKIAGYRERAKLID